MKQRFLSLCMGFFLLFHFAFASAHPYIAFSLKEAQKRITSHPESPLLHNIGGITDLAGMVYDPSRNDWILVGTSIPGRPSLKLHEFALILRCIVLKKTYPLISIDSTAETAQTGKQIVRYEPEIIRNSSLALDMVLCDILLKKLALHQIRADILGIPSYWSLALERIKKGGNIVIYNSRFWAKNLYSHCASREGVIVIYQRNIGIETEILSAESDGKSLPLENLRDPEGDLFAKNVSSNLEALSVDYPVLKRIHPIFTMISLAEHIRKEDAEKQLKFWLFDYILPQVETPKDFDLIQISEEIEGKNLQFTCRGGIHTKPMETRLLKKGYLSAFKSVVLKSRPAADVLIWNPPLQGWKIPGVEDTELADSCPEDQEKSGFSIETWLGPKSSPPQPIKEIRYSTKGVDFPKTSVSEHIPYQPVQKIGGVMLSETAKISGSKTPHFSFLLEGEESQLDPDSFRKFITTLWAVYYCKQDPGISIDPIAPGVKKHLVRYIGKILNSDIAMVMREADYLMKKWAIGTERPEIKGFKDLDHWMAQFGFCSLGVSRRLWITPEDMQFIENNGKFLFQSGKMSVKTEYILHQGKSEPADRAFADFFTKHYFEIAKKYPVYQELFEYAKLVSLAKYLKKNNVPLFWMLMANKHLVLTEDSPGTVDALTKNSENFRGLYLEGGVDFRFKSQYVYDREAIHALEEAFRKTSSYPCSPLIPSSRENIPASFSAKEKKSYTVVPQHSLTCGKDKRGIRYHTDIALRDQEGEPGLELARYYPTQKREDGEFGNWHLLIPYRIKPVGTKQRQFRNVILFEQMAIVHLLTGEEEILTFSTDRYSIAGYVPDDVKSSQVVGLFLLSNACFRLVDKIGNEFQFDPAGYLTDMIFSEDHSLHFRYEKRLSPSFFEKNPYRLLPDPEAQKIEFANVFLPDKLKVFDLHGHEEIFLFTREKAIAGYIPQNESKSRFTFLALLSDGSFQLLDKESKVIVFDRSGYFVEMILSRPFIQSVSSRGQSVSFAYTIAPSGKVVIKKAYLSGECPVRIVEYHYDSEGRLYEIVDI